MRLHLKFIHPQSAFRIPHFFSALILVLVLCLALSGCSRISSAKGNREAERLADRTLKFVGGRRALNATRYLTFDFTIQNANRELLRRSHTWDRKTGRYRLEGVGPDGQPYVALFNVNTRQGKVFVGNNTKKKPMQPAPDQARALEAAWLDYQSDTAWLLCLSRLRDPGVQLALVGPEAVSGRTYQVVAATASGPAAGELPGVQNWVHIDPETGRPLAWTFIPPGQQARAAYVITDWQPVGKASLPVRFARANSPFSIVLARLSAPGEVGNNIFDSVSEPLFRKVRPLKPEEQGLPH